MKKLSILCSAMALGLLIACGGNDGGSTNQSSDANSEAPKSMVNTSEYDPKRGEGKWNKENVELGASVNAAMATEGKKIFDVKCASCHKLSDERLVGPGWKGVTTRQPAPWIMNFITNPDAMIDKDPELQAQLEICLVRMPNQNLTDEEARKLLEFMRQNDGVQ
ncbi:MAG: c-type cytochrome [Niabella sp.]